MLLLEKPTLGIHSTQINTDILLIRMMVFCHWCADFYIARMPTE